MLLSKENFTRLVFQCPIALGERSKSLKNDYRKSKSNLVKCLWCSWWFTNPQTDQALWINESYAYRERSFWVLS